MCAWCAWFVVAGVSMSRDLVLGFAFGFFGGLIGLLVCVLMAPDYLPGALMGFVFSFIFSGVLAVVLTVILGAASVPAELGVPDAAPASGGVRQINLDGSPVSSGSMFGDNLAMWVALIVGGGMALFGAFGAALLFLCGGEQDDGQVLDVTV